MVEKSKGFGVASLVCGILSIVFSFMPYFGLPLGILAIVFYFKQKKVEITGVAKGGLVTGIIGTVFNAVTSILLLLGLALFSALV